MTSQTGDAADSRPQAKSFASTRITPQQSVRVLEAALDGLASHIVLVDHTGEIVFSNKSYRDFVERNGITAMAVADHLNYLEVCDAAVGKDAEYAHAFAKGLREVSAGTRSSFELEYPCHSLDEQRWFIGRITPLVADGPKLLVVAHDDITDRKLSEEALRLQARRAGVMLELAKLAERYEENVFMKRGVKLTEELTDSNISFMHLVHEGGEDIELVAWSRRTLEHYVTVGFDSYYPVSKAGSWADALRLRKPVVFNDYPSAPHQFGLPEGHPPLQRLISVPVIEDGQVVMLATVGNKETDYTEFDRDSLQLLATAMWQIVRKDRTTVAALEAKERIERLALHVPGALYQLEVLPDGTTRLPYSSMGILDVYGILPEAVVDDVAGVLAAIHPDDRALVQESIQESARSLSPWTSQHRVILPDGRTIWVEGEATPEARPDGSVLWHGYIRDVTSRMETEAKLRKLTQAVEQSDVTIVITDASGSIEYANPHFEKSSGYTVNEALGQNPRILRSGDTSPETYAELWRTVLAGNQWRGELHNKRKDGSLYWESVVISPVRTATGTITNFVAVKEDITERKRLEEERTKLQAQLTHVQKMESVGRLAGGIAHDFNNILTVISGTVELALSSQAVSEPYFTDFSVIQEAAQRATTLTRRLLTFSRRGVVESRELPVNEVLTQTLSMLRRMVSEDVVIETQLATDAGIVRVDVGQLEQVITNLTVNARDAMPQGGRITISTSRERLVEGFNADLPAGDYVRITVRDTGTGMSPAVMDRLFEPFFTTKAIGKGTGLGLAIVYGIVTQSGGSVTAESTLGQGTAFHVFLPRLDKVEHGQPRGESSTLVAGRGIILVVDDEPVLGKVTQRILQKAGYTVLLAQSGREALRLVENLDGRLDLLLSDVIMPDMSGPEVAAELQARDPKLRVLYVSGHSGDILSNHGLSEHDYAFISKPYSIPDLTGKVKELIAGR